MPMPATAIGIRPSKKRGALTCGIQSQPTAAGKCKMRNAISLGLQPNQDRQDQGWVQSRRGGRYRLTTAEYDEKSSTNRAPIEEQSRNNRDRHAGSSQYRPDIGASPPKSGRDVSSGVRSKQAMNLRHQQ